MADLARIKRNVAKMASQGAPVEDIDGYISSEGVTVDDVRNFRGSAASTTTPAPSGRHLTFEEGAEQLRKEEQDGVLGATGAFLSGALDVPVVGPAIRGGYERVAAGLASLIDGEDYAANLDQAHTAISDAQEMNPGATIAGNIAGSVGSLGAIGSTARGARLLGITGNSLKGRAAASAASSAAISGADALARGGDAADVINNTTIGAGIGGAVPVVGAGLSAAGRAVGERVHPIINSIKNPDGEAARRVGMAVTRDIKANPQSIMTQADEVVARQNGVPIINADRGGEVTRALTRSVANQSPEARAIIEKTANDRFSNQSYRAAEFLKRLMTPGESSSKAIGTAEQIAALPPLHGGVDDLAFRSAVRMSAAIRNKAAYDAANSAPEARAIFTPEIQGLFQSPSFRRAVDAVPSRSADRVAAEGVKGFKGIKNPFTKTSDGEYILSRQPDGSLAIPNLQFWDQVKRNLDSDIGKASRAGDNVRASDLIALKNRLVNHLDAAVPAYKTARQGAFQAFNAEDAIDAGKAFANQPRLIPEARKALEKMGPTERSGFATGFASELIDKIKASGDRTNVINSIFKSQASREQLELVLGPAKAREIEAYVRVEDLADRLRGAMGNSTTARQLMELGIGAGGGWAATGDWTGALTGAALAKGARFAGERIDNRVMTRVAKMLTSDQRGNLAFAVHEAAKKPEYMKALENLSGMLAIPARAAAISVNQ